MHELKTLGSWSFGNEAPYLLAVWLKWIDPVQTSCIQQETLLSTRAPSLSESVCSTSYATNPPHVFPDTITSVLALNCHIMRYSTWWRQAVNELACKKHEDPVQKNNIVMVQV